MTKLLVEPIGTGGISFGPPVPFSSAEVRETWSYIVAQVLVYAFLNRPAWFINVQPQQRSLGYELTDSSAIKIGKKEYLLIFKESCTEALLKEIAGSEDFKRGLFWLTSLVGDNSSQVEDIVRSVEASNFFTHAPQLCCELLLGGFDYAETLYWFNPMGSLAETIQVLFGLARSVGWDFESLL